MNDNFEGLKREYREIVAPPTVAARIAAEVDTQSPHGRTWIPLTATAMAAIAAVWFVPLVLQQQASQVSVPTKPSLSALAALKPNKPSAATPNLSQMRSLSIPKMPTKPKPLKPQTNNKIETNLLEEKNHAFI